MRKIGMLGVAVALVTIPVQAERSKVPCLGVAEGAGAADDLAPYGAQLLSDGQCEAVTRREFRLQLLEIPQDGEDPMALSIGIKNGGGLLRFKIPFSF